MQKKTYQTPQTEANEVTFTSILCASGETRTGMTVTSNPANNLIGD